jgi:DNA modification methylase
MTFIVHTGDALATLRTLPTDSVHCVVTSPPYWGLRDYGCREQIGMESSLALTTWCGASTATAWSALIHEAKPAKKTKPKGIISLTP